MLPSLRTLRSIPRIRDIAFILGKHGFHFDPVLLPHHFDHVEGFRRKAARVQGDDTHFGIDSYREVQQHHAFGLKARQQCEAAAEAVERPAKQLFGGGGLKVVERVQRSFLL